MIKGDDGIRRDSGQAVRSGDGSGDAGRTHAGRMQDAGRTQAAVQAKQDMIGRGRQSPCDRLQRGHFGRDCLCKHLIRRE